MTRSQNAFTVAELVVVLIVSLLVFSIGIIMFTSTGKYLNDVSEDFEEDRRIHLLNQLLWQDMAQSSDRAHQNNKLHFYTAKDTVVYTFFLDYITRNNDSIATGFTDMELFYQGDRSVTPFFDAVKIKLKTLGKDNYLFIYTDIYADHYMNQK